MQDIFKQKIAGSFSEHSSSYDQYSLLQEKSAGFLLKKIRDLRPHLPEGPVLEVGCGSGLLSTVLADIFAKRELSLLDIAPGMLRHCRKILTQNDLNRSDIKFVQMDAENISDQGRYALIVSGLTIQWFNDLENSLLHMLEALRPGGSFIFSFLAAGSFSEWSGQCLKSRVPCTLNPLPDSQIIYDLFRDQVASLAEYQKEIRLIYPSVKDFFWSIKRTGAGVSVAGKILKVGEMKRLIANWQDESPHGVELTCNVHYIYIVK